jgi:hypothetical protein
MVLKKAFVAEQVIDVTAGQSVARVAAGDHYDGHYAPARRRVAACERLLVGKQRTTDVIQLPSLFHDELLGVALEAFGVTLHPSVEYKLAAYDLEDKNTITVIEDRVGALPSGVGAPEVLLHTIGHG